MPISLEQTVLPIVVIFIMLTVGMELRWPAFQALILAPRKIVIGTVVHTLTFPLLAVALVAFLQASRIAVEDTTLIGVLLIAACPSGGFSNVLALIARANLPLSVMLTAISSLLSFVTVPLLISGFGGLIAALDKSVHLPVTTILLQLLALVVGPIGAGMLWRQHFPAFVEARLAAWQRFGQFTLYLLVAGLIAEQWNTMLTGMKDALPWSLLLCAGAISLSYLSARQLGMSKEDAVTVSLEASIRNLAVALLIASSVLNRLDIAALPTVYMLAVLVVGILFAKNWRRLLGAQ